MFPRTASPWVPSYSDEGTISGYADTLCLKYEQVCGKMEKSYEALCGFPKLMNSNICQGNPGK